ncbi:MAG: DUF4124 domain-containing protein, partial [Ectothiorhodospira sp.]
MKVALAVSMAAGIIGAAQAQVYRCETPDGVVFSQTPCANDAQAVEVRTHEGDPESRARIEESISRVDKSVRHRLELQRLRRELQSVEDERDRKLKEIDRKVARAANNLAGATWEQALAIERQNVLAEYDPRIQR